MVCTPCLVTQNKIRKMPKQIYWHQPTAAQMDAFSAYRKGAHLGHYGRSGIAVIWEDHRIQLDGSTKHSRTLKRGEIIANPAHTNMGRWHVLDRRFEQLSKQGAAIHAAKYFGNDRKQDRRGESACRGRQVGVRRVTGNIACGACSRLTPFHAAAVATATPLAAFTPPELQSRPQDQGGHKAQWIREEL